MSIRRATIEDLLAIRSEQPVFWGERDLSALHHVLLVHDFGETAFILPGPGGEVLAYLFGMITPGRYAYSHLVAVREGHRREGHARRLYEQLERVARDNGIRALKALTQPSNVASIAFHTSIGFSAQDVPGYVGVGETRTIFWKPLQEPGAIPPARDFARPLPGGATMRPVRFGDADAIHDTIEAERDHLARHLRWTATQTRDGTREYVARSVRERLAGAGLRAVILAPHGRVIGMAGFVGISAEDRCAEIGYWLAAGAQGHGTMTAAVAELVDEAFGALALNRLEIKVAAENARSRAIPERLGFREEGRLREAYSLGGQLLDDVVYGLLASDRRERA